MTQASRCEDCGSALEVGREPISEASEPELWANGERSVSSDWCPNLDCPSNNLLRDFRRVGVAMWQCKTCDDQLLGSLADVRSQHTACGH